MSKISSPITARLRLEWQQLTSINHSDRSWLMPFCAALSSGIPLLVGVYFDHLDYGLVSSLGGLAFLYLPNTSLTHRMIWLIVCAFSMCACYALGLLGHFAIALLAPMLGFIAFVSSVVCRYFDMGPPGIIFFVMAAAVGAYMPIGITQVPLYVGLFTLGTLLATIIALYYSVHNVLLAPPLQKEMMEKPDISEIMQDSLIIAFFVGLSLALAQALQMERPYWVPVSCVAVIQGNTLRAVWNRQGQRIIGTCIGLMSAWLLLSLPLNQWIIPLLVMLLTLIVETLVVRNYALGAMFFTPLSILLADAAHLGQGTGNEIIQARLYDTILGSVVGLVGGYCLHSPKFRKGIKSLSKRLLSMQTPYQK